EQVSRQGLDVLPELIQVIVNNAMLVERQQYMNAEPYQRTSEREAHATCSKIPGRATTTSASASVRPSPVASRPSPCARIGRRQTRLAGAWSASAGSGS
ncbi:MAG: hypothetical protein V1755_02740, partial [Chloroflexota bacterium]